MLGTLVPVDSGGGVNNLVGNWVEKFIFHQLHIPSHTLEKKHSPRFIWVGGELFFSLFRHSPRLEFVCCFFFSYRGSSISKSSTSNGWWCSSGNKQLSLLYFCCWSLKRDFEALSHRAKFFFGGNITGRHLKIGKTTKAPTKLGSAEEKFLFVLIKYLIFLPFSLLSLLW